MLNSVEVEFPGKCEKKERTDKLKSRMRVSLSNIQLKNLDLFEIKTREPPPRSTIPISSIVWCLVKCRVAVRLPVVVLVVKSTAPNPNAQLSMNHCSLRPSHPLLVYARGNASRRWFKVSFLFVYQWVMGSILDRLVLFSSSKKN